MTGFTGVRWETRQADRLSRDLSTGAGPKPLYEAGVAWSAIARSLKDLDADLAQLRKSVVEGWSGSAVSGVIAAVESLSRWVADTSEMAGRNAEAAERQAIAHTVAVVAMPDAAVIEGVSQLETALKAVVAPPSALISGGIAKLEEQAVGMKAQASRVMESYEQATTPVSKPMHPPEAPKHLADSHSAARARADAEEKAAAQNGLAMVAAQSAMLAMAGLSGTNGTLRASDQYVTQTARAGANVEAVVDEEVGVKHTSVTAGAPVSAPFVPGASATQASNSSGAHVVVAANYDSVQDVVATGTTHAAPSVIGVTEREEG